MNKTYLIDQLMTIKDTKRIYRDKVTSFVIEHPDVFPFLIELVFNSEETFAIKSAWVLELVYQKNNLLTEEYIDYFIVNLNKIKDESALRPMVKDYHVNKIELLSYTLSICFI